MKAAIPVNGQSTALGMAVRKVQVEQVVPERGVAIVSDKINQATEIPYRVQHGRGRLPKIGEIWYVDRTLGPWTFLYFVAASDEDFKTFNEGIIIPSGGQVRIGAVNASNTAAIAVRRPLVADAVEAYGIDGDSSSRFVTTADGGMSWGPGGVAARDTLLTRSGPGVLQVTDSIITDVWHDPIFQSSWGTFSVDWSKPGYRRNSDRSVSVRGIVSGGTYTSGTPIFTLPVGYRPPRHCVFSAVVGQYANGSAMRTAIQVNSNGGVNIHQPNTAVAVAWVSLDGISFSIDQ